MPMANAIVLALPDFYTSRAMNATGIRIDCAIEWWHVGGVNLLTLGERLRAVRKISGVQMQVAAEKAGISKSTVTGWQRGETPPTIDLLNAYVSALGAELIVEVFHPSEGRKKVVTTNAGAVAAAIIDAEGEATRDLALRLIRALPRLLTSPSHRPLIEAIVAGVEDLQRQELAAMLPPPPHAPAAPAGGTGPPSPLAPPHTIRSGLPSGKKAARRRRGSSRGDP
jgi:transcriptional regulator with XRE-family HTH domain